MLGYNIIEDDSHVSVTAAKSRDLSNKYSLSAVDLFCTERGLMRPNLIVKPPVVNLLRERKLLKLTPCPRGPWSSPARMVIMLLVRWFASPLLRLYS